MNRTKVLVYVIVVVVAALIGLRQLSVALRDAAVANLDALLSGAVGQVAASARNIAREASAAAAFTARDEALVAKLNTKEAPRARRMWGQPAPRTPEADVDAEEAALGQAARSALSEVEKTFGFELPGTTVVTAGNREWLARKGPPSVAEGDAMKFLRAAIDGRVQRGWVRLSDKLFYGAAAPAGSGAGLMVLVPLDDAWVKDIARATGVDVTVSIPNVKVVTTSQAAGASIAGGKGPVGPPRDLVPFQAAKMAIGPLPGLPALFGTAPAVRGRGFALDGVENGAIVVSAPAEPGLTAIVRLERKALAALLAVLFAGVVVATLVRTPRPSDFV